VVGAERRPAVRHAGEILALVAAAQFMVILDVSVVNVALPAMRSELGFSPSGLQWVVNAYTLTFGGFLLLGGRAADLFGRRRLFLIGVTLFTLASLAGGLAQSTGMLVAARAVQGVGGAIVAPATLSILTATFREGAERNRAFAVWGAVGAVGGSAGAIVGGVLTDVLGWRWILFVNIPIGAAIVWRAWIDLPRDAGQARARSLRGLDVPGALLATVGLSALVFGIVRTDTLGWGSGQTAGALLVGAGLLAVFLVVEALVAPAPLLPLRIFRIRQVSAANLVMFALGSSMFAMWYFLSLYFQEVLGDSPLRAGFAFLPLSLTMAVGATQASKLVGRFGVRPTLVVGFVLMAVGMTGFSRLEAGSSYVRDVLPWALVVAVGSSITWVPLTTAAMSGVPRADAGLASGLINVSRQVGGALGLAILATIATSVTGGRSAPAALTDGYDRAFLVGACFAAGGAVLSGALLRDLPAPGPAEEAAALGEAPLPADT
jgi:EmrB/QacA subfamily drug resistance transporter